MKTVFVSLSTRWASPGLESRGDADKSLWQSSLADVIQEPDVSVQHG